MLWRHGRTAWNAAGRFQGQLDPPLDDVGAQQATVAGRVLAATRPDVVVASDSIRAACTAGALGLPFDTDSRLREINLGAWQGLTGKQAKDAFPAEFEAWLAGMDVRRGNGETYAEVGVRARAALASALAAAPAAGSVLAVTHGGTCRAVIGTCLELPPEHWWRLGPMGNCRWSVLVEAGRGWRLAEYNAGAEATGSRGDDR